MLFPKITQLGRACKFEQTTEIFITWKYFQYFSARLANSWHINHTGIVEINYKIANVHMYINDYFS